MNRRGQINMPLLPTLSGVYYVHVDPWKKVILDSNCGNAIDSVFFFSFQSPLDRLAFTATLADDPTFIFFSTNRCQGWLVEKFFFINYSSRLGWNKYTSPLKWRTSSGLIDPQFSGIRLNEMDDKRARLNTVCNNYGIVCISKIINFSCRFLSWQERWSVRGKKKRSTQARRF